MVVEAEARRDKNHQNSLDYDRSGTAKSPGDQRTWGYLGNLKTKGQGKKNPNAMNIYGR